MYSGIFCVYSEDKEGVWRDTVTMAFILLGGPNITANLYCICLSEHETRVYADAAQI